MGERLNISNFNAESKEVEPVDNYDSAVAETLAEYYRNRDNVLKQNGWDEYQLRWDKIDKNFDNLILWLKQHGIEPKN